MNKSIVFMFSGQGSQFYNMGKELYQNQSRFKVWMDHCNEIVQPLIKTSLIDVLYNEKYKYYEPFDRILYSNPALLSIEYSLARLVIEMNVEPDYLLGYSLGEITSCVLSDALSLEEGLQFVVELAMLLEENNHKSSMLAILESIDIMTEFPNLFRNCWVAGKNFSKNFVVGGLQEDIRILQDALYKKDIITQQLPVNYGFHTKLMDRYEKEFYQLVRNLSFAPARIPVISSLKAQVLNEVNDRHCWEILRNTVEFEKTIQAMLQKDEYVYIDVGPSGTLSAFVKYISKQCHSHNNNSFEIMNQFGKDINTMEKFRKNIKSFIHYK